MTFDELLKLSPDLKDYTKNMPERIKTRFTLKRYGPNCIIHQKDDLLTGFGIVCQGQHRVINEFENGNIFMIEKNSAVSFIGEVALLAGHTRSSVTIETLTECLVMYISLKDFEEWVLRDIHFLRRITQNIARKLYSSSYNRGEQQYYSVRYILLKYLIAQTRGQFDKGARQVSLRQTRQLMAEEMGLTIKTLNRTVAELRQNGILSIQKGKVAVTAEQYRDMEKTARQYAQQSKRGHL